MRFNLLTNAVVSCHTIASAVSAWEYARHYHLLREYSMDHAEVREILAATD